MDKRIYAGFIACCTLLVSSCTQEPASVVKHSASSPAKAGFVSNNPYKVTVEVGDTLYNIARKNNVEVRAVIDANRMRPPYTLIPGQTIKLPKAAFHTVSDSDNLYAISRSYNVDIGRLAQKNNLTPPYNLTKGQKLLLPSSTANESGTTSVATKIDYDFGTKESYGASRGVSSSDLPPIGSKEAEPAPTILAANNDDSSPFSIGVSEENLPEPNAETIVTPKHEVENFDKKVAEPFSYKSESEFGDSAAEEKVKQVEKAPEVVVKKPDTKSVNKDISAPIKSEPIQPLTTAKSAPAPQAAKPIEEVENPFAEANAPTSKPGKVSKEGFIWPASGKVISGFGPKKGGLYNDGINIAAKSGSDIKAASDGEVVYSGNELRGYGNMLLIKHNNGYLTAYAHASEVLVKKGDVVTSGQTIGRIGRTGHVSSPQLHFSIRQGRKAIDPAKYLP